MTPIARLSLVALDTDDTETLAEFYSRLTGWEIHPQEESDWLQLDNGEGVTIAFQEVDDFTPPEWPGSAHPQQLHIDFDVDDLDTGEEAVMAIGARKADHQPGGESFRVYLDPSGHPFCLVRA